jgi:hypothetical protein
MRWLSIPLVKENLRRNWAIAAFGLLGYFFAVYPALIFDGADADQMYYLLRFEDSTSILFNTLIPLLSAITALRYLQEPGTVAAMHSC